MDHADIIKTLEDNGHEAYYVGGCVRDSVLGVTPTDYDIVTDALPERVLEIFPGSKNINAAFSVAVYVKTDEGNVEVATMRRERNYKNGRPQDYEFVKDLNVDLARRDARFNAMAMDIDGNIIDPYNGMEDINKKVISAVGNPIARIKEHPIRVMRYVRFAASLNFVIADNLEIAISDYGHLLATEKWEAISKEFIKGLVTGGSRYVYKMNEFGLLSVIIPELDYADNQLQNNFHYGSVMTHTLFALAEGRKAGYDAIRLIAILLHDIGKMKTAMPRKDGLGYTFYGHQKIGANMARDICKRLRLSSDEQELIYTAVLNHMSDINSKTAARRFINRIAGNETRPEEITSRVRFVVEVIVADKMAHRVDKEESNSKISKMIELVEGELTGTTKFSTRDLAVNGNDIMEELGIQQGPDVGKVLNHLLGVVMADYIENEREALLNESKRYYVPESSTVAR